MADKKIFKPDLNPAAGPRTDFLEELNLPPRVEEFLRGWYKILLLMLVTVIVAILTYSFGSQYLASRDSQAAEQLAAAMQISEPAGRQAALEEVAASYGRTGSGIWSRIELAHIERESGDLTAAVAAYEELLGTISSRDPRSSMVRLNLAQVLTELGEYDRARSHYRELSTTPGFEAWGLQGEGRLLALQNDPAAAEDKYQQVLELENAPSVLLEQAAQRLN